MNVSVVVVCNRRLTTLYGILGEWQKYSSDVWLADCSGLEFSPPPGVHWVRFKPDPGNRTRHAIALLTTGDMVIKADDDFVPGPFLVGDLWKGSDFGRKECFVGIMGRRFEGPKYYGNTISARANKIAAPEQVDFVGICTMSPRSVLAFDLRGCSSSIEELFQQCGAFPTVPKYAVPSLSYSHIPGADRPGCLCKDEKAQKEREAYYSTIWERCRELRLGIKK